MSKEITFKYLVESKVKSTLLPEVDSIGFRLQHLAEEILEGKEPKEDKLKLQEIIDGAIHLRQLADALR